MRPLCSPLNPIVYAFLSVAWVANANGQGMQDHQYSTADIEVGSRIYANQCALCHGPNGDLIAGVNLRGGQFRSVVSDQDIRAVISSGVPAAGMPPFSFRPAELDGLVAFIRAGFDAGGTAVRVGDPALGMSLFEGKGGCLACHRVNGVGSRAAPDLSEIGAIRQAAALQRTLLDPTSAMLPINRPVRVVTSDGRTIHGRRLNEDTYTVQMADEEGRLVSFEKADLREYEIGTTSRMPSVAATMTADELAHLVAYLLSLRGIQ